MASWSIARRVVEACVSTVTVGRNAVVKGRRTGGRVCLPRRLCSLSQKLGPASSDRFLCSYVSASSASAEGGVGFRRPEEIEWQKELANSVMLIGRIHRSVDIRYLDSGKIVATTSIRVNRPTSSKITDSTVFVVQFWDELAEIAAAHLKKEDRVFIAGSIWVESHPDNDNLQKTTCKVVARDLKFVGADYRNEQGANAVFEEQSVQKLSLDERWKDYFDNPHNYWDNRIVKRTPKTPDFKHKITGSAMWIEDRNTPFWVKERLEQVGENLDAGSTHDQRSKAATETEKLWQAFFANPSDWWDNRSSKKGPKYPDFKHKLTGEALWIESYTSPSWVKSQLAALDMKAKTVREGGGKVDWSSTSKERIPKTSFEEEDLNFF